VTIVEPECVESIDVLSAEQQIESLMPDLRKTGIHPNY
jgi:hypothetical protein